MLGVLLRVEQCSGIASETSVAAVDVRVVTWSRLQRQSIKSADENGFDRAVCGACVRECALTGCFQASRTEGLCKSEYALRAAQPFDDAITEQLIDELGTSGTDGVRPLQAPLPIFGEECPRFRRQVIKHRAPIAGPPRTSVAGDQPIVLENRDGHVGGPQPQGLPD